MLHIGRVHILTDTTVQERYSHVDLARMALEAGVPTIQYRRKEYDRALHLEEVQTIARLVRQYHAQLIINDHLELAVEVGATGLHLGEEDMPLQEAFRRIPPLMVIGATVHSLERYAAIRHFPLAYVGVGPVFETSTKVPTRTPLGIEGLRSFVEAITHPVIAIGGITVERAKLLFESVPKLHGVAVLSAFCAAEDPIQVARNLLQIVPKE
ncbi:MAG: thiamine phosphate synthase [Bacteroidia bacterium]|nr:thiamine phosphate synthase [Bacteroidia bacterium]MDW8014580.1 thiamine phosphate synthase [Bacteroidia bacterium]